VMGATVNGLFIKLGRQLRVKLSPPLGEPIALPVASENYRLGLATSIAAAHPMVGLHAHANFR
jgi:hypothetical protein